MGFDITFHPVSLDDLRRFVFEVADRPALAEERAAELARDDVERTQVLDLYGLFGTWLEKAQAGQAGVAETFAFACAAIAGYRHPFWFARGCASAFLVPMAPELADLYQPLPTVAEGAVSILPDPSGGVLPGNHAAGGIVRRERFADLRAVLHELSEREGQFAPSALYDVFGKAGLESLERALQYAEEHELDLIEASEVVIPAQPKTYTRWDNMRAHYLKRLDP